MLFLGILEALFIVSMLSIILLFVVKFTFAWSWAQSKTESELGFIDILSSAAVEWGAVLSLVVAHIRRPTNHYEAPPLKLNETNPRQIPIIFVPSLHTSSAIFGLLIWRLKNNFWNSLWTFNWKLFLDDPILLEDQLEAYISKVIRRTETKRFRIVSFGSSRPVIARLLDRQELQAYCDRWIGISSAQSLSPFYRLLHTKRLKKVYEAQSESPKQPDLVIHGENDFFCFPSEVFGDSPKIALPNVGHYGSLLHSTTTQTIMKELAN